MNKAVTVFPWINNLKNLDPSKQVEFFNNKILNIASNFIPNKFVKIQPKDPPWITDNLRRMIKKQNKQYKKFLKNGRLPETKTSVDKFRNDCFNAMNLAKKHIPRQNGNQTLGLQIKPKNVLANSEQNPEQMQCSQDTTYNLE